MQLHSLSVLGFRNLETQTLALHPRTTVLVGHNGQGKTNVLEAVSLLAALRSFRTARLAECLRFGATEARVHGHLGRRGGRADVELRLSSTGRRILVDGKALRSAREYGGDCSAVVFVPEDLTLARGSPEGRRRFLDRGVYATSPAHLADLLDYERALRARNTLVRDGRLGAPEELAQREVLARCGAAVLQRRLTWVAALRPLFRARFAALADAPFEGDLSYESTASLPTLARDGADREALTRCLLDVWARSERQDGARGFTTAGPHCDDVTLTFGGHPLRVAGSQGQQRAFVLALKLAEIAHAEEVLGEPPLLLLDDVGSELDEVRRAHLFEALARGRGQVLLTTTSLEVLPDLGDHLILAVEAGRVTATVRS